MIHDAAIAPPTRPVLLLVKAGEFKHRAGYYLLNGRWHKVHKDKPTPKGVPMAAHKHAAGQFEPVKHLTDDEWAMLQLSPENSNAGSYNKQLYQLKQMSEAGDVTGILGMSIGINTYGKKLAVIANHLLELHGTEHKVAAGQKAGTHAAVQAKQEAVQAAVAHMEQDQKQADIPASEKNEDAKAVQAIKEAPGIDAALQTAKEHMAEDANEGVGGPAEHKQDKAMESKLEAAQGALAMPDFQEGKSATGVVDYYQKVAQKIIDHAQAGNVSVLEDMKASGLKPNGKGKVSNTWAGKTANSKMLLALHAKALEHAGGGAAPKPGETGPEASDALGKLESDIANAGSASKAVEIAHGYVLAGKSATWAYNDAIDALQAAGYSDKAKAFKELQALDEADAAKAKASQKEPRTAQAKKVTELQSTAAPAATPPDTGSLSAQQLQNLQSIPWFKLKLPDSNTNAKSHNAAVAKIEAMAFAGDKAGLQAFIDAKAGAKQTYAKKQALLAQTALAGLQVPGATAAAPVEPAPAAAPAAVSLDAPQIYENTSGGQSKFWSVSVNGKVVKVSTFDKIGAQGNEASTEYSSEQSAKDGAVKLIEKAKANGFVQKVTAQPEQNATAVPAEQGPKEGDTKPGADGGTLVFKNGRWHKQDEPQGAPEQHPVDAIAIPDFESMSPDKWGKAYVKVATELKDRVKQFGADGLKGVVITHNGGEAFTIKLSGFSLKKIKPLTTNPDSSQTKRWAAMHKFVTELKAVAGKPAKKKAAPKPASAPASTAAPAAPAIESIDKWEQTGPQGGSNPGGRFKDDKGVEWYCKFPADESIAKSEVLAAKLYAAAGVDGQDAKLITKDGKIGIASRWVTVNKAKPADLAKAQGTLSGFAVDAWLANWDVVGLGYDNLQLGADGKAVRVDAGGSLEYRAQGSKKPFGGKVDEIDTLRDAKVNPQAASIFGKMTQADITASVSKVAGVSDAQIRALVEEFGPGDKDARKALAETLIARKADLLAKYPKAAKSTKKRLDPTKLPVSEAQLPKPHDFANWNGAGHGLSSKAHVNAANHAVEQQAFDVAMQGNLPALKEFKYHGIDKETGNATGVATPIAQHPSKHVVQYHADLVQALDEIANPPQPLKVFRETDVGTLAALEAAFPPKPFGTTVGSVSSTEKMGFWVALGAVAGVAKFAPKKVMDYSTAAIAAAKQKYLDAKPLAKHFIKSVQASGSYNDLFRDGKSHDHSGNKLTDVAQAALEHATEMPEGTSIYRWQAMTDQMLKHIMSAPDGTVFQATGPMCTSYSPTATKGFGKHRIVIRYAKGAKAVESFASGGFVSEKEVTTLPNNRFIILSKKMVPDTEHGNPSGQRAEIEVLMLPPDLGIPGVKG